MCHSCEQERDTEIYSVDSQQISSFVVLVCFTLKSISQKLDVIQFNFGTKKLRASLIYQIHLTLQFFNVCADTDAFCKYLDMLTLSVFLVRWARLRMLAADLVKALDDNKINLHFRRHIGGGRSPP